MILVDPDLNSDPAPRGSNSKRAPSILPTTIDRNFRVPSARTLARFLREAQTAVRLRGQVSVLLTTDRNIRRLNRQFRSKDKATDVISFPIDPLVENQEKEKMAGDLAVSVPTALFQAGEQGHSLSTELKVLILHGLLHLAGYDHERDNGEMARRERLLRSRLGLPQGLIERASEQPRKLRAPSSRRTSVARVEDHKSGPAGDKQTLGAPGLDSETWEDSSLRGGIKRRVIKTRPAAKRSRSI